MSSKQSSKQSSSSSGKRKWQINVPTNAQQQKQIISSDNDLIIESPLGFSEPAISHASPNTPTSQPQNTSIEQHKTKDRELKEKKVWELARSPLGNLALKCVLMYMSGNQIHIFPILITAMALMEPLKALFSTNATFEMFEKEKISTLLPKLMFIALNAVGLGVAMAKCYWLGVFDGGAYQAVPLSSQISFFVQ